MDDTLTNVYYTTINEEPITYVTNISGSITSNYASGNRSYDGSYTVTVYPESDNVSYRWQYYNPNNNTWTDLSSTGKRFTGMDTNTLTGAGEQTGDFVGSQFRCKITIDGVEIFTKEKTTKRETNIQESEGSIGEAIQLITTKTFPVATEAFMTNDMWLLGMGFFTLTFLGVFLHWLFRRGRR